MHQAPLNKSRVKPFNGLTQLRILEFLLSLPVIPLWMALAAPLPVKWSAIKVYFAVTIILSIFGWCGLARVVGGKLLELREEDFVMAARIAGATDDRIILRHLLPGFLSYLVIGLTLSVPYMILGETALSFLGIGLREPAITFGGPSERCSELSNYRTLSLAHDPGNIRDHCCTLLQLLRGWLT